MNLLFTLLTACVSSAYIPEYSLIAARAADQHGKGGYLIEQDVVFRKEGEVFAVKETWLVSGENSLRVTLEGRGSLKGMVEGTLIYDGAQKHFVDLNGGPVRAQRLGEDWLEPLFHFRNSKYFRSKLVSLKVAPPESTHDRSPLSSEGDPKYEAPGYVRMSRVGGSVAWAIGLPPAAGSAVHPAVWIEQDQFVIRKFRSAGQVVLRASDYNKYDEGFWFPRQRTYTFGPYTIEIQTLLVKPIGKIRPDDPRFRASSLNAARDGLKLPEADALKEFYSRFR